MVTAGPQTSEPAQDMALFAIAGAVLLAGVLWAAGVASARLSGHPTPHGHPYGALSAFVHFGDPSVAWHAPVGPAVVYWAVTSMTLALLGLLAALVWRLFRADQRKAMDDPTRIEGLADRRQVKAAAGPKALLARAGNLRPSLDRPSPGDVGYRLGSSRGVECWSSVEDSMVLLGPPRSGKGYNIVIPMLLSAPGAVITTATRADNLAATMTTRAGVGPVGVFDPHGLATGVSSALRWSRCGAASDRRQP